MGPGNANPGGATNNYAFLTFFPWSAKPYWSIVGTSGVGLLGGGHGWGDLKWGFWIRGKSSS